ncbi:acyltransferase [Halobacillus sp. HZG1]|uniref:acyltransferase n=1 Tax=Halobacillus sp. HZG1 TaxID=3111769 RepID=UPI002DBAA08C|nr:acyltransferase [Halobacillus sp. HZG1]MEC3884060.1 acyltransferase [Halobacillus sp. HZG1]
MNIKRIKGLLSNFCMYIILLFTSILPNSRYSNKIRGTLLAPFFKKCGRNLQVASGVTLINPRNITIGDNVYIAHNTWINGTGGLEIESDVIISPMVVIATTKHSYIDGKISNTKSELAPILIKSGTWIASNSVITKGVIIGKGSIIGACSAVTREIPDFYFAGGVPAKPLKKLIN